jgi:hypothetical protein
LIATRLTSSCAQWNEDDPELNKQRTSRWHIFPVVVC